mgnify:CR=1 FL=1
MKVLDLGHLEAQFGLIIREKENDTLKDVRIFSKSGRETQTSIHSKTGELSTIDDATSRAIC